MIRTINERVEEKVLKIVVSVETNRTSSQRQR